MEHEKELALRATQRDPEAFAELYDLYADKIYTYIYYKVGNAIEAEDLMAEVFTKAWEAIGNYEWQVPSFGPWLFRIAHNLVVDYHRTRRPVAMLETLEALPRLANTEEGRPDQMLADLMLVEKLRHALSQLTEEQQTVIILRFIEGYNSIEVAEIMGKRHGAIRALQFRGLTALREILSAEEDESG